MTEQDDIKSEVGGIFRGQWVVRDGNQVPEADDLQLGNNGVRLDATVLYADLADSTGLVGGYKSEFAAEVFKAYLRSACRLVQQNQGSITAFDGDRLMAVFVGDSKNTRATRTSLELAWVVDKLVNPMLSEAYPKSTYKVRHATGIDTGLLLVARTGVRGSNDLVWVGKAANYAAKMSAFREGTFTSWITKSVFEAMHVSVKTSEGEKGGRSMWEARTWKAFGIDVYASGWMISPG